MSARFRTRLLLAAAIPALIVLVLLLIGFLDRHANDMEQALLDRGKAAARQLGGTAEFSLFVGDPEELQRLVKATQTGDGQIVAAVLLDHHGLIRAEAGRLSNWKPVLDGQEQWADKGSLLVGTPIFRSAVGIDDLFSSTALPGHDKNRHLLGYAVVELSRKPLEKRRQEMFIQILGITLVGLLFAALLSARIAASVTRPISHISDVVSRIEQGELTARTDPENAGVLAPLAAGINTMATRIAMTQEELREQVAIATRELQREKDAAEKAARIDSLTGVANRRAFDEFAEREVQRALRYGAPLSVLIIDLDHFKRINDTHGHHTGDAVLMTFTRTLTEMVRSVDLIGRWGGEEFVVLLPDTAAPDAMQVAERMRSAVAACQLRVHGQLLQFSASFGVATLSSGELTFYDLLTRADSALYRAKALGRNRVELALAPPPLENTPSAASTPAA